MCYAAFRSQERSGNALPEPIKVARSTDGGSTWTEKQVSAAVNNRVNNGRQDCWIRTTSTGTLFVFWDGNQNKQPVIFQARSFDGGQTFTRPQVISPFVPAGLTDPVSGDTVFDGVAGVAFVHDERPGHAIPESLVVAPDGDHRQADDGERPR